VATTTSIYQWVLFAVAGQAAGGGEELLLTNWLSSIHPARDHFPRLDSWHLWPDLAMISSC
jgi:hypothetical protein